VAAELNGDISLIDVFDQLAVLVPKDSFKGYYKGGQIFSERVNLLRYEYAKFSEKTDASTT
jgi:hypothetical protein